MIAALRKICIRAGQRLNAVADFML